MHSPLGEEQDTRIQAHVIPTGYLVDTAITITYYNMASLDSDTSRLTPGPRSICDRRYGDGYISPSIPLTRMRGAGGRGEATRVQTSY